MKKCQNCGEMVSDQVNFCPQCGELLVDLNSDMHDAQLTSNDAESDRPRTSQAEEYSTSEDKDESIAEEKWSEIKENVEKSFSFELVLSYLAGYGQFFVRTLMNPSVAFANDYYLGGAINLIIFAILLVFASGAGFLLNLLAVPLYMLVLYGVSRFILNNEMSFYDVIADFGGQLSLTNVLLLIVSFFGDHATVGPYLWLVFAATFLVAQTLYIFKIQKSVHVNRYYQMLGAYVVLLLVIALFWSQGML